MGRIPTRTHLNSLSYYSSPSSSHSNGTVTSTNLSSKFCGLCDRSGNLSTTQGTRQSQSVLSESSCLESPQSERVLSLLLHVGQMANYGIMQLINAVRHYYVVPKQKKKILFAVQPHLNVTPAHELGPGAIYQKLLRKEHLSCYSLINILP
jgi:hypothetical protein